MQTITVGSIGEARREAARLIGGGAEFVMAQASATAGGVRFELEFGRVLFHKSGAAVTHVTDVEEAMIELVLLEGTMI